MTSMHMTTNFPIKCLCIKDFYKKISYCYLASREVNLQNFDLEKKGIHSIKKKQYARSILMIFLIAAKNLNIHQFYQCILQKYKIFYYILVYCYLASRNENLFEYDPENKVSVLSKKEAPAELSLCKKVYKNSLFGQNKRMDPIIKMSD